MSRVNWVTLAVVFELWQDARCPCEQEPSRRFGGIEPMRLSTIGSTRKLARRFFGLCTGREPSVLSTWDQQ